MRYSESFSYSETDSDTDSDSMLIQNSLQALDLLYFPRKWHTARVLILKSQSTIECGHQMDR